MTTPSLFPRKPHPASDHYDNRARTPLRQASTVRQAEHPAGPRGAVLEPIFDGIYTVLLPHISSKRNFLVVSPADLRPADRLAVAAEVLAVGRWVGGRRQRPGCADSQLCPQP